MTTVRTIAVRARSGPRRQLPPHDGPIRGDGLRTDLDATGRRMNAGMDLGRDLLTPRQARAVHWSLDRSPRSVGAGWMCSAASTSQHWGPRALAPSLAPRSVTTLSESVGFPGLGISNAVERGAGGGATGRRRRMAPNGRGFRVKGRDPDAGSGGVQVMVREQARAASLGRARRGRRRSPREQRGAAPGSAAPRRPPRRGPGRSGGGNPVPCSR